MFCKFLYNAVPAWNSKIVYSHENQKNAKKVWNFQVFKWLSRGWNLELQQKTMHPSISGVGVCWEIYPKEGDCHVIVGWGGVHLSCTPPSSTYFSLYIFSLIMKFLCNRLEKKKKKPMSRGSTITLSSLNFRNDPISWGVLLEKQGLMLFFFNWWLA